MSQQLATTPRASRPRVPRVPRLGDGAFDGRRLLMAVAAAYLLIRAFSAVLIAAAARGQVPMPAWTDEHVDYLDMVQMWDGGWYRRIAEQGYPDVLPRDDLGRVKQNPWAFYPMLPMLARLGMRLTGLPFAPVASTIALLTGLAAALLMAVLLRDRIGAWPTVAVVAVWAASPPSPSLQLAYTEGPAMVLLCFFLLLLVRREWVWAGLIGVVIGLTRPIAVPLGAVLALSFAWHWWQLRLAGRRLPAPVLAQGALGLAGCGLGAAIWPMLVWRGTGLRTAYTDTMASWRGSHEIVPFKPWLGMSKWVFRHGDSAATYGPVSLALLVLVLLLLVCGPWAQRLGVELRAWCLAYPAYLGAVLDPYTSIYRYLLPLFPLVAVVLGVAARRQWRWWPLLAVVLVGLGLAGEAVWVWELLVYHPPQDSPP
ncbi:MAG: hypothetical protein LWW86_10220 [Micrococcales bacterium]|nr:hypothetical protein [Micrococcales bacterium]